LIIIIIIVVVVVFSTELASCPFFILYIIHFSFQ